MICRNCGRYIPNEEDHCPHCGEAVEEMNKAGYKKQTPVKQEKPKKPSFEIALADDMKWFAIFEKIPKIVEVAMALIYCIVAIVLGALFEDFLLWFLITLGGIFSAVMDYFILKCLFAPIIIRTKCAYRIATKQDK